MDYVYYTLEDYRSDIESGDRTISSIINAYFPTQAETILTRIANIYNAWYVPFVVEEDNGTPTAESKTRVIAAFNASVEALAMQYGRLEETQAFYSEHSAGNIVSLQSQSESKQNDKLIFENASSPPQSRLNNASETDIKGNTTAQQTDGRNWLEAAENEGVSRSPVTNFINAFGGLLLLPDECAEDCYE